MSRSAPRVVTTALEVGASGCFGSGSGDVEHPVRQRAMTRSERTSLALEGVEGLAAFGFKRVGSGAVATEDESTGEEADQECEEMGHGGLLSLKVTVQPLPWRSVISVGSDCPSNDPFEPPCIDSVPLLGASS